MRTSCDGNAVSERLGAETAMAFPPNPTGHQTLFL